MKRLKANVSVGDLFEINVSSGVAYALYTHPDPEHSSFAGLIRVLSVIYPSRRNTFEFLESQPVQFSAHVGVGDLVREGLLTLVAHIDLSSALSKPPRFKMGMPGRPPNYWTCQWSFCDYGAKAEKFRRKLPAHSVRVPKSGFTGFAVVTHRIECGYTIADWLMPDNIDWEDDVGGPDVLDGIAGLATWTEIPCPLPRTGDLIEISVPGGLAFGLVSHDHRTKPCWGPLLRVFRGIHPRRPRSLAKIIQGEEQFSTFTLITEAIRRGMMSVVANVDVPSNLQAFPAFKRQKSRDKDPQNRASTEMVHDKWLVWAEVLDAEGNLATQILERLPRQLLSSPFKEVVLPEKLIRRIETGWTPADDVEQDSIETS